MVTRKRSDIDFDAFSDAKRRKTEKGKFIYNNPRGGWGGAVKNDPLMFIVRFRHVKLKKTHFISSMFT